MKEVWFYYLYKENGFTEIEYQGDFDTFTKAWKDRHDKIYNK